jgi:uncharacterized protein (DUF2344 family)
MRISPKIPNSVSGCVSFGPALALGVASLDEKIEVDLIEPPKAAEMLSALNAASGAGLRFTAADPCAPGDPGLGTAIHAARYILAFAETAGISADALHAKVASFIQRDKIVVKRDVRGIGRLVDVKSRVLSLKVGDEQTRLRVARAGIAGRVACLEAVVTLGPEGSVKPAEIVEAVMGDPQLSHQAIRDAMLLGVLHELPKAHVALRCRNQGFVIQTIGRKTMRGEDR